MVLNSDHPVSVLQMFNSVAASDVVLSILVSLGIVQLSWFSVMLARKKVPALALQHSLTPLLSLWVLMWPVYIDSRWLWFGVIVLCIMSLLCKQLRTPFWRQLHYIWTVREADSEHGLYPEIQLLPLTQLLIALLFAGIWFQYIPEFGFGLALCLCLAFPAAYWMDHPAMHQGRFRQLGFPAHPQQTLAGHLLLICMATVLLSWSLHVYHGTDWSSLFIATLITAMTASVTRALIPGQWNIPAAMLSMGFVMWVL